MNSRMSPESHNSPSSKVCKYKQLLLHDGSENLKRVAKPKVWPILVFLHQAYDSAPL